MNKSFIKKKEKELFLSIIDDFLLKKKKLEKIISNNLEENLHEFFIGLEPNKFLYQASSLFFPFIKKCHVIFKLPLISNIFQNIVNNVFISGSHFLDDKEYVLLTLNILAQKCLDFIDFIKKYNINHNQFFKEYFVACFLSFMLLPLGKISNFDLYDKITKIWIMGDNIADGFCIDPVLGKKWVVDASIFFQNKLYLHKNLLFQYFSIQGNPIIDCIKEIMDMNISQWLKNKIFNKLQKLFKFSYFANKKKEKNSSYNLRKILQYTCLKARKSLDIFIFTLDTIHDKKKFKYIERLDWNPEFMSFYYNLCLHIQLLDDLVDIPKDIRENSKSIFTTSQSNEKIAVLLLMNQFFNSLPKSKYYFKTLFLLALHSNSSFINPQIKNFIEINTKFINLQVYNLDIIFWLIEDTQFMYNYLQCYLLNNKSLYKNENHDQLIQKVEKFTHYYDQKKIDGKLF